MLLLEEHLVYIDPTILGNLRHLIWYCPWNVGTGIMLVGIRAGAEMTSFENRFIALRVRDVHAPTGTIAVGVHSKQINARRRLSGTIL